MLTVPPAPGIRPRRELRQPEHCVGTALHPSAERRHLQPAAQHLTVHLGPARRTQPRGDLVEHQGWAVPGAGQVGGWPGRRSVPNSARSPPLQKDGPLPAEHDLADRRIQPGHLQRFQQRRPRVGGERVVPLRPVEPDQQQVAVTFGHNGIRGSREREPGHVRRATARTRAPACSVEYASDSVITPASAGPSDRRRAARRRRRLRRAATVGIDRSARSSASGTEATVTVRRSSEGSSVSVKVASSEGGPVATTTPPASSTTLSEFTSTS